VTFDSPRSCIELRFHLLRNPHQGVSLYILFKLSIRLQLLKLAENVGTMLATVDAQLNGKPPVPDGDLDVWSSQLGCIVVSFPWTKWNEQARPSTTSCGPSIPPLLSLPIQGYTHLRTQLLSVAKKRLPNQR
jgi:hypothetical protein